MGFFDKLFKVKDDSTLEGIITLQDREEIREKWREVDQHLELGKPSNLNSAVIMADKLLDFTLRKIYPNAVDFKERLILSKSKFSTGRSVYEDLWYAHRIRNELVHKVDFFLPNFEAKNIIENYRKGLQILGAL